MTTQVVGEAAVNLRLDTEQYEAGFDQAERTSRSRGANIRRSAVVISGALAGIGLAGAMMAEQNQKAFNAIAAGTGASGEALKGMESIAVEVAGTVPGNRRSCNSDCGLEHNHRHNRRDLAVCD